MVKIKTNRKQRKTRKQNILVIILVILLALAFVLSRAIRTAGRKVTITLPGIETVKQTQVSMNLPEQLKQPQSSPKNDIPKNLLLGQPNRQQRDSLLVTVARNLANREGMLMHHEAYEAFLKMREAASADGISLTIVSAFRDFDHQKRIWENKWYGRQVLSGNIMATSIDDPVERAREILRFSAMPGTSRHHWGTDIDLNSLNNNYFLSGRGKQEYDWLVNNAQQFGFCQPYISRNLRNEKGYEEEKWHWSYMPVASKYLAAYTENVSYEDIQGFAGMETAQSVGVIENYVKPIAEKCLLWKDN
jgi:LAS superfamily LD-carboxypeptidase LdcB